MTTRSRLASVAIIATIFIIDCESGSVAARGLGFTRGFAPPPHMMIVKRPGTMRRAVPGSPVNPYGGSTATDYGSSTPSYYRPTSSDSYQSAGASGYADARQYQYRCEINSSEDDAGAVCRIASYSRRSSGDGCRCHGQSGTIQ